MTRWMGLDPGERRTGVALSDASGLVASPLTVIAHASRKRAVAAIAELAQRNEVEGIVVGLPKNMDGTEGAQARQTRRLAEELRRRLGLPVRLADERLTTFAAEEVLAHLRPAQRKERLDAVAASFLLQDFLDAQAGARRQEAAH